MTSNVHLIKAGIGLMIQKSNTPEGREFIALNINELIKVDARNKDLIQLN